MYERGSFAVCLRVIAVICVLASNVVVGREDYQNNVNASASDALEDLEVLSTHQNATEKAIQQAVPCKADGDCIGRGKCEVHVGHLKFCSLVDGFNNAADNECQSVCGLYVKCKYDQYKKPICVCEEKEAFDSTLKACRDCECGYYGTKCEYRGGKKVCKCAEISYEDNGYCRDCDCGDSYGYTGCSFNEGKKICQCKSGYTLNNGLCKMCFCGKNSKGCSFENGSGKWICACEKGYLQNIYDRCEECDCGTQGNCSFDGPRKVCKCKKDYAVKKEKCEYCSCGLHGNCSFSQERFTSEKKCQCDNGYAYDSYDGSCKVCNCGNYSRSCSISGSTNYCKCQNGYENWRGKCEECDCGKEGKCELEYNGDKSCRCHTGFQLRGGTCEKCDCGPDSTGCYFNGGAKHCQCNYNYEDVGGYCKVILACSKPSRCPSGTKCIDKLSSFSFLNYECKCLEGYNAKNGDPMIWGCEAVDGCEDDPCGYGKTCTSTSGGGYRCDSGTSSNRSWRTASIVLGVLFAITLVVLAFVKIIKSGYS